MPKIYCRHKNQYNQPCPNACLEYDALTVIVRARHRTTLNGSVQHENHVDLFELLALAVEQGDGEAITTEINRLTAKKDLTGGKKTV